MVFCSKCGAQLPEDAYFCPKCGFRTQKGKEAGAPIPVDDLRRTFRKVGKEMEKAFQTAVEEMQEAFKTAKDTIRESTSKGTVICSNCGERNSVSSIYCHNCGKKLRQENARWEG